MIPMTPPRVFVSTDLGGDPDDIQSLYRLVHFSDHLAIEGIISSPGPQSENRVEKIRHWLERIDVEHLRACGHPELMREEDLLAATAQGSLALAPPGPGRATEGSRLLITRALAEDPAGEGRPLWVLAWGSLTDVAQALHDEPAIAPRLRLYGIGSSNTRADPASRDWVYRFMQAEYPELWWIENGIEPKDGRDTFRGVYDGGDQEAPWGRQSFIEHFIRGRGTTRGGRFKERCGDAFPLAHWPQGTLKEGDTPTFLYLLSPTLGGVGDLDDPTQSSWGGTFRAPDPARYPHYWCDLEADAATCRGTISRYRRAWLEPWAERWAWYGEA